MTGVLRARTRSAPRAVARAGEPQAIPIHVVVRLSWGIVCLAAVVPLFVVSYAPMYDYHQWVYQGRLVSDLFVSHPEAKSIVSSVYSVDALPVPNSAAPAGIALFTAWLSPENAAHVFAAICVLAFAFGFAFLTRTVQRKSTVLEFLGVPFATGYFLYKGYVSYLLALAIAFAAIALLHRASASRARLSLAYLAPFTALGVVLFYSHLVGWLMFALALDVYAAERYRRGARRDAGLMLATQIPVLAMLLAYGLTHRSTPNGDTALYHHLYLAHDKLISLGEPLALFLRPDPFDTFVPVFWLNALAWLFLIAVAAMAIRSFRGAEAHLVPMAAVLGAIALVLPFYSAGDLLRPDERFVLPALLLFAAALPWRELTAQHAAVVVAGVCVMAAAHGAIDYPANERMEIIEAASEGAIPADAHVLSLTVHEGPLHGGCGGSLLDGPSFGAATLQWFGLYRIMHNGSMNSDIEETSFVDAKSAHGHQLTVQAMTRDQIAAQGAITEDYAARYGYVELFGCPDDIAIVRDRLNTRFEQVTSGDGFAILRRTG